MNFTHGSLFSGIGGFDIAAEWMGWDNLFHCEWNPFGRKVLKHYWPNAESFNDITKTDFTKYENKIDVLTGGFPCQPYSTAGKRRGKQDDRHLWPEMLRAIREIRPAWVVGENFPTVAPIRFRNDGLSDKLDGITFSKWRNESIKAAGNAIVPHVALQIFQAIDSYNFIY